MKRIILIIWILALPIVTHSQGLNVVRIVLPQFDTPPRNDEHNPATGRKAATILGLQIWADLRKADRSRPRVKFGMGETLWNLEYLPPTTQESAEERARWYIQNGIQNSLLILWGDAFHYGDGIVVRANLSILQDEVERLLRRGIWRAELRRGDKRYEVSLGIPSWQYKFAPVVLRPDLPDEIDDPSNLKLYRTTDGKEVIGKLGPSWGNRGRFGDYVKVAVWDSQGREKQGYIYSPFISTEQNEIADFTSGVIRILRGDWNGALELFQRVIENKNAPTAVKIDSYIFMAIASDYMGNPKKGLSYTQEAYRLNPYMKTTTQYLCMSYLKQLARMYSSRSSIVQRRETINLINQILTKNAVLFGEGDAWIRQVNQFVEQASK